VAQLTSQELDEMVRGQTITSRFAATVQQYPDAVALREKDGTGWHELTWTQYAQAACRVATGLAALGVTRGSRVGLFMRNRPEFHILDMAALLLGATPFSIYNSSAPDEVAYLVGHSHATVVVVEDTGYLAKVMAVREELPALEHVVVIESSALDAASAAPHRRSRNRKTW
jgi:long-chain acyl-CoA synthetase